MLYVNAALVADAAGNRSAHAVCYLDADSKSTDAPSDTRLLEHERAFDFVGWSHRRIADLSVLVQEDATVEFVRERLLQAQAELSTTLSFFQPGFFAKLEALKEPGGDIENILPPLVNAVVDRVRRLRLRAPLRLNKLSLRAFRGIASMQLDLPSDVAVFAGPNGCGKSTILDALGLALSHLIAKIQGKPHSSHSLSENDIMSQQPGATISVHGLLGEHEISCELSRTRDLGPLFPPKEDNNFSGLDAVTGALRESLSRGDDCLPVLVTYPVNRAVLDIPLRIKTPHVFEPLEAYDGAYRSTGRNFRLFFEWFRNREDLENQFRIDNSRHRDHQLEAVRQALASVIPEISEPRVLRSPLGLIVKKGQLVLFVDQLSDGEKCLMAMVGDLARRLAMANPYADKPLEGGGVVLIDEIELHLHPGWQRRLVPALQRTFPGCQFILTTHSPAVLSHVDRDSVFLLRSTETGIVVTQPDVSKGADVSRILEDLLDVPARPEEFQAQLRELFRRIDAGELGPGRDLLEELRTTLGSHDPEIVRAEVLLHRKERAAK